MSLRVIKLLAKARKHNFQPVLNIKYVREFENKYDIVLPESYVDLLTKYGNGGVVSDLTLFPLDRAEAESAFWLRRKSGEVFLDKTDMGSEFAGLCSQAELNDERYDEILAAILNGALMIGSLGCTMYAVLMCKGKNYGSVGIVDTDLGDGFQPRFVSRDLKDWLLEYPGR